MKGASRFGRRRLSDARWLFFALALATLELVWPHAQASAADFCPPLHPTAGVYISSGEFPQGQCTYLTADAPDVGARRVRSVEIVGDYAATLYSAKDYAGSHSTFVTDSSPTNLRVGSVRIRRGGCDGRPGVYLYAKSNHRGRCSRFTADVSPLYLEYVLANEASSIRMVGSYTATLYRSSVLASTGTTFVAADSNFGNNPIGHDRAGSLRVRPSHQVCGTGVGVLLYEGAAFTSRCSRFTSTVGSLAAHYIGDNTASSIRLLGGYQATLFANPSLSGTNSPFTGPTDANLADDAIGDNRASSVRVTGPFPEQEGVRRLQVRLGTGDIGDAGTDDSVLVSLNQVNTTWVDYGRDDFERGDVYTYDVLIDRVRRFNDLKWLTVSKTGSDGWCVSRLEIRINGRGPSFVRTFSPCRWLDNEGSDTRSLVIPFDSLRGPRWSSYSPPPADEQLVVSSDELESRIAGIVGNALRGSGAEWRELGSNAVIIGKANEQAVHVVLKLFGRADLLPDPNIDVSFDLQMSCADGVDGANARIHLRMANVDTKVDFPNDADLLNFLGRRIGKRIEGAVPQVDEVLSVPSPRCPGILIGGDGAIVIVPDLRPVA